MYVASLDHPNTIERIKQWFETVSPHPSDHTTHDQISSHFAEISGLLGAFQSAGKTQRTRDEIQLSLDVLNHVQRQFKAYTNGAEIVLDDLDRAELLGALCKQIVTAIGLAHMLEMDIVRALSEVASSNDSTFDARGQPIFNEQQKILKGPNFFPPSLSKFV